MFVLENADLIGYLGALSIAQIQATVVDTMNVYDWACGNSTPSCSASIVKTHLLYIEGLE